MSVGTTIIHPQTFSSGFKIVENEPRIVISGGRGFIGSHLAEEFPGALVVDLKDGNDIRTFDFPPCDVIFHLAARAAIPESFENPLLTHDHNVTGTLRILEHARRCGARVVFSSSSSIYGEPRIIPTPEYCYPDPVSPYACSKLVCEQYMRMYWKLGVKSVALRYFNVFGERQEIANAGGDSSLALGIFLRQRREGKPITIVGDGLQRRDFVYVKDVVGANLAAAEWLSTAKQFEAFNVGSGVNHSILEVRDMVMAGEKRVVTEFLPPRPEPRIGLADITHAKFELQWETKTSISQWLSGLTSTA